MSHAYRSSPGHDDIERLADVRDARRNKGRYFLSYHAEIDAPDFSIAIVAIRATDMTDVRAGRRCCGEVPSTCCCRMRLAFAATMLTPL